jgi:hypothetical protein
MPAFTYHTYGTLGVYGWVGYTALGELRVQARHLAYLGNGQRNYSYRGVCLARRSPRASLRMQQLLAVSTASLQRARRVVV